MLKRVLNNKSKTIAAAAVVLGAASLISRFLGLVRDRILAGTFGAGDELDIYYAAFRIPDLVYSLLVMGAISAGFIPVFINYLEKDKKGAWRLANNVLNLMTLSLIAVCALLIIFSSWLIKLVAPGFPEDKLALVVNLTRVMFLSPLFLGLSAVLGGILQSFKRFLVYSFGPIMYNLGIIFGALVLVKYFGLLGLAYGVVLGAFLHMAVQIPTAVLCGYRWRPVFNFGLEGVSRIFRLMPPRVLSLGLSQLNLWVMTALASFLSVGSIAVYNLANNIWSFPVGIFGVSFALAAFPKLSEFAQKKDKTGFVKTFSSALRQILFFTLPAGVFFVVLRLQIVQIILGAGKFSEANIVLSSQTLAFFSLSLFSESLILLFLRGFFAWEDAWRPFLIGLVAVGLRIWLAKYFSGFMGAPGLALGFSIGSVINLILLFASFRRKFGEFNFLETPLLFAKVVLSSLLAGLVLFYSLEYFSSRSILVQTAFAVLAGGLSYLFFARLLRVKELNLFLSLMAGRLPWRKAKSLEMEEK